MNCYEILGISPDAPANEIIRAHRKLVKKYHPDKLRNVPPATVKQAEEMFKQVQEAYETLTRRRAEYDKQLRAEAASVSQRWAARPQPASDTSYVSPPYSPPAPSPPARPRRSGWHYLARIPLSNGGLVLIGYFAFLAYQGVAHNGAPAYLQWSNIPRFGVPISAFRTERFEGQIHNPSTNSSTNFKIAFIESGRSLSGCMAVDPPLTGSGPLSGRYSGNDFNLIVRSSAGKITLKGERRDEDLWGTYHLEPRHKSDEAGTFTLWRVDAQEDDESLSFINCPTDEELHPK